jgi:hypothetical protein
VERVRATERAESKAIPEEQRGAYRNAEAPTLASVYPYCQLHTLMF